MGRDHKLENSKVAKLAPTDRFRPCVLHRLRDDKPEIQQNTPGRGVSLREYKESVREDLDWLFSCRSNPADDEMESFPEVARSVLNYGIPDLVGLAVSTISPAEIEAQVRRAVLHFEPRIVPESLSVSVIADPESMDNKAISFEIRGELWAEPIREPFCVKSLVDLDTGVYTLEDEV